MACLLLTLVCYWWYLVVCCAITSQPFQSAAYIHAERPVNSRSAYSGATESSSFREQT